jgi:hypothetical protein
MIQSLVEDLLELIMMLKKRFSYFDIIFNAFYLEQIDNLLVLLVSLCHFRVKATKSFYEIYPF